MDEDCQLLLFEEVEEDDPQLLLFEEEEPEYFSLGLPIIPGNQPYETPEEKEQKDQAWLARCAKMIRDFAEENQ